MPETEYVDVEIIMTTGGKYMFPGVQWLSLWLFIKNDTLVEFPQLSLVNNQRSCLTVPTENLEHILIDGQVYWSRPLIQ